MRNSRQIAPQSNTIYVILLTYIGKYFILFIKMDNKEIEEFENKSKSHPSYVILKPVFQAYLNIHRIVSGRLKRAFDHLINVWNVAISMGEPFNTNPVINSMLTKAIQMYEYFSWLVNENIRLINNFNFNNPYDFTFINSYIRNVIFYQDMQSYRYYEDEVLI